MIQLLTAIAMIGLWCYFADWMIGPFHKHARVSQIRAEISSLESGIAAFKTKYGVHPPSGVTLHSTEADWQRDQKSQDAIRALWPNFDFKTCGGIRNVSAVGVHLNGAECLVFFLGGITDSNSGTPIGFKKHFTQPLSDGNGREPPFFEFDQKRFVDLDGDGYVEYLDPFPGQKKPFLYISSKAGLGYDLSDFDHAMNDVYRQGRGKDAQPWKPDGCQIVSAGIDGDYGKGGSYNPMTDDLRSDPQRTAEFDNMTNFSPDVLVKASSTFSSNDNVVFLLGSLALAGGVAWFTCFCICSSCRNL